VEQIDTIIAGLSAEQMDQMLIMRDGVTSWSATHGWPGLCEHLKSKGLIKITGKSMWGNRPQYSSVPTQLGTLVRAAILKAKAS